MYKKIMTVALCIMCFAIFGYAKNVTPKGGKMMEIIITKENFKKEVLEAKLPVLVDFFATWCGPCKMLAPTLEEFAEENAGKIIVGKCDIDAQPELADEFKIQVVPTIIAFKNGKAVNSSRGLCSKKDLLDLVK